MSTIHSLQNNFLRISVKEVGAELCEITSTTTGTTYMWEADPAVWANYAPVLFPIIGELKDGAYFHNGIRYQLPRHGIVRNNPKVQLSEKTESSLSFVLQYDEDTLLVYPFRFRLTVTYALDNNRIINQFKVENLGNTTLYFSVGGHPAFCCPRQEQEDYTDYYLEFAEKETSSRWVLASTGLLSGETQPVFTDSAILPLTHELFEDDALVFKDIQSNHVSLKSTKSGAAITLHFAGFPYLGIWAKPQGNYVCIEPWLGIADSVKSNQRLKDKEGIISLGALDTYTTAYTIEVEEP